MPSWNCCVMNCNNNTHGPLRFFSFPKDEERRRLWAESCGRTDWYPTDLSRICEIHFDKSQFEQNQQDGKKLLKWTAIPRMYEEWTRNPTSPAEENFQMSYGKDYGRLADEGTCSDYKSIPGGEMKNVGSDFAAPEVEGTLEPEQKKTERLKRKRAMSDHKLEEEYQLQKKEKNEISEGKGGREIMYAHGKTDELEDELLRIKADIRRLLEDVDIEPTSDVYETSYETDGETNSRHISPMTNRRSNFKASKTTPGTAKLSSSSLRSRYLQETNSASLQPRQRSSEHSSQSNKTLQTKKSQKSSLSYSQLRKEEISCESSSVPSVTRTGTAYAKQYSLKQLQSIKSNRRTGSTVSPPSQLPKNQVHSNVTSEKVESIHTQNLSVSSRQNALLQEILGKGKPEPKRDSSAKPWRAPDELVEFMRNEVDCFAPPGENRTLSKIIETPSTAKVRRRVNVNSAIMSKASKIQNRNSSEGRAGANNGSLRIGKVETNSIFKDVTKIKKTSPRIIKVKNLNLLKGAEEISGTPLRDGVARSSNSSKIATRVNETVPRIGDMESRSSLKDEAVKKVVVPRIIKVQSVDLIKNVASTGETQSSGLSKGTADSKNITSRTDVIQRNLLQKTIETPLNTCDEQNKTALKGTSENKNSEVLVGNNEERNGSKTNSTVANPPMSKSAHLKKLLASMLSLEEDMFSDEANLQMLKECNENTKKKLEVGVQADISQLEDVAGLKTEILQLKKQLEEKDKLIQQLQQSLAAVLPPGQIIMLESENDEKYVIFNQQQPSPS